MHSKEVFVLPAHAVDFIYPEALSEEEIHTLCLIALAITYELAQDGIYIQGIDAYPLEQDHLRVGFYRQPERYVREYVFSREDLEGWGLPPGLPEQPSKIVDILDLETIQEIQRYFQPHRTW